MRTKKYGPAPVSSVEPCSAAQSAGLVSGDMIWEIDGRVMRDAIDLFLLLADDGEHRMLVERAGALLPLHISTGGTPPGIGLESLVFDGTITCDNSCPFCFVDRMPSGLREDLYVKDDDYRLSFLQGNFITLTNLRRSEISRIIGLRLSPLYVSLHSTEPGVRRRVFGNQGSVRALKVLGCLLEADITVHAQIVLIRGVNNGEHLERTLSDIRESFPGIASVGVVPVGLADSGTGGFPGKATFDGDSASLVLEQLDRWKRLMGDTGLYAADEFFMIAGEKVPPPEYYDGFPQLENGIGLARSFLGERPEELLTAHPGVSGHEGTAVLTTPSGLWALEPLGLPRHGVRVMVVENTLFGERVTVCGLLPGRDVLRRLSRENSVDRALLPEVCLSGGLFIDGMAVDDVMSASGKDITVVPTGAADLVGALVQHQLV